MRKFWLALLFAAIFIGSSSRLSFAQENQAPKESPSVASGDRTEPINASGKKGEEEDPNAAFMKSPAVVSIGKKLGMNAETSSMVFQYINFAVLAGVLIFALAKSLPKLFRGRTSTIQKQLVEARAATQDANSRLAAVEDRLSKLDGEIASFRAQAVKDSAADEKRIKESIEEEKHKIVAAAEQETQSALVHAQRQLKEYAAGLAIEQAAQKLQINAETDRLLVQSFAERLGGGKN